MNQFYPDGANLILVAEERLELSRVAPHDFESCVYTIPPLGLIRKEPEISDIGQLPVFSLVIIRFYRLDWQVHR